MIEKEKQNMGIKKVFVNSDNTLEIPKKFSNTYPLKITTSWWKRIIYHKKDSLFETEVIYYNSKSKPYIDEGLVEINGEIFKLEKKVDKMEKTKVCSYCEDEIEECDWCGKRFRKGNEIICLGGENHFCSKKCLDEFLKEEAMPAEVILEDW